MPNPKKKVLRYVTLTVNFKTTIEPNKMKVKLYYILNNYKEYIIIKDKNVKYEDGVKEVETQFTTDKDIFYFVINVCFYSPISFKAQYIINELKKVDNNIDLNYKLIYNKTISLEEYINNLIKNK